MATLVQSPSTGAADAPASSTAELPQVGLLTRVLSWAIDQLLINLVAIITGLGVGLIVTIFPITKHLQPLFEAIAGGVYVVWTATYFVAFWSVTGQTPGARVMQVRLVTANREKVRPGRAVVRWVAMNLAMLPLPWGLLPIPFKRLGFPDWAAHTRVIEAPQLSIAAAQKARLREAPRRPGMASASRPGALR